MDYAIKFISDAKTDAYMMTTYKRKKIKTKTRVTKLKPGEPSKCADVIWNEEIWIPAMFPFVSSRIVFKLMDEDKVADEVIGSLLFDLKDILTNSNVSKEKGGRKAKPTSQLFWKNIYGSPLNQSNSPHKSLMNENPEMASTWKGRVLCQVICEETTDPKIKPMPIEEEIILQAKPKMRALQYDIIFEIG